MINENPQAATNEEQEMSRKCNCEHWQQCAVCKSKAETNKKPENKGKQEGWPDWVCKSNAKAEPTPHKHAQMIKEWADDPSRFVEYKREDEDENDDWNEFTDALYDNIERFDESCKWRFAYQAPIKPEIVSSLSDAELIVIFKNGWPLTREAIRAIANAAAKRAVEDYKREQELLVQIEAYPLTAKGEDIVSSLNDEYFESVIIKNRDGIVTGREIADAAAKLAHAEGYQAALSAVRSLPSQTSLVFQFDMEGSARKAAANKAIAQFQADLKKLLGGV